MSTAIVAIGRNEGERLRLCLESASRCGDDVVYVDSGSVDGSCELARRLSAHVVELDPDRPFSAARARNAGFDFIRKLRPDLEFVQFVDGDCELDSGWIELAMHAMAEPQVAVVCGRRRERYPESSVYNLLCDIEWDTPIGEADACGGDAFMRVEAFVSVDGFDDDVVAGEEPDLCLRLRKRGWRIERVDAEMTLHDADMHSASQWGKRMLRAGHAYAEGVARHGLKGHPRYAGSLASALLWGGAVPGVSLALLAFTPAAALLWLSAWSFLTVRIYRSDVKPCFSRRARMSYALSTTVGMLPNFLGASFYALRRLLARPSRPIEYKGSSSA